MQQPDFGEGQLGILGICGTILLYGISLLTVNATALIIIHAIASIAAAFAGFATGLYYVKKSFFTKKNKDV